MMSAELKKEQMQISKIPFIDLHTQQQRIRVELDAAIAKVLNHGIYIMGPEVTELEHKLALFCGVKHAITCSNGTDALALGLRAKGVGLNDAIFVPSFTFAATAEVVVWLGATPIFIDILEDTFNMDPRSLEQGIQTAKALGLKPRGIIPVDMFGQPADYDAIQSVADTHNLWVLADAAQSFGATYKGRKVGNIGDIATTSFFPAKPLGCYGDGGAIFTNDDELAQIIKSLRVHGQGSDKYDNVRIGMNGRLDTIQAAILLQKLNIFPEELEKRNQVAKMYNESLNFMFVVPKVVENCTSSWAQYTIRFLKKMNRELLVSDLNKQGIPTMVYYIKPLHMQIAYQNFPTSGSQKLSISEKVSLEVLSLPMHPYLELEKQQYIIDVLTNYTENKIWN